ncbi:hypothetical protein CDV36_000928 [Fusarium kuroshium]|uniref:Aspartate-semialdehyde dehydrogenase n=1 Tax=Fusarium kuroshium TaxID=2010991 RepID=A0A3M2SPD2_9HYPO|nr:hypothetical protein CDV36_000928 [Fusarium kuroshium]
MNSSDAAKHWLVQKYGGTSLGKLLDTIANRIIPSYCHDYNLAVVCSAISGSSKASGTTSLLIQCISHAEAGPAACRQLHECVDVILKSHTDILRTLSESPDSVESAAGTYKASLATVQGHCEDLRKFLLAAQTVRDLSSQTRDRIIALGEKLACIVLAAALTGRGIPAEPVMLDNVVEAVFGRSLLDQKSALNDLGGDFYRALSGEIAKRIHACGTKVPVLSGFFGIMPESLLKAVGRGYSDLCAAMCAVGMNAVELQIWKEVDGIFTADPRKVSSARLLSTVTPDEATELTYYGSEVIHPLTMDQIRHANIPLRLKNVFNPSGSGTVIYPSQSLSPVLGSVTPPPSENEAGNGVSYPTAGFMLQNGYHGAQQERRRPTAVTVKDSIILVNIACNRNTKSYGLLSGVFGRLEELGVNVDLVSTSERNSWKNVARQVKGTVDGIYESNFGQVIVTKDMAIVSVIGHKMRNKVGVASEILSTLAAAKINIYLVSQGASEINVSLVVRSDDANLALNTIHDQVLKIPSHQEQEHDFIKGVLGGTGSVGQQFILLLEQHPYLKLQAIGASSRSAGKKYRDAVRWKQSTPLSSDAAEILVSECEPREFSDCDIIFSGLDSDVAGDVEMNFLKAGFAVFSNAKNHRGNPLVPLVVPTVNLSHLDLIPYQQSAFNLSKGFLVCNSNCAVIGLVGPLSVLQKSFGPISTVSVVTMQAISGAGYPGVPSIDVIDNIIPYIEGEEDKLQSEAKKILGTINTDKTGFVEQDLTVSASCNRVPVIDGHMACVSLNFSKHPPPSVAEIKEALKSSVSDAEKLGCWSAPKPPFHIFEEQDRPQPRLDRNLQGGYAVSIGRIRADDAGIFDLKFVALSHNTVLGAAGSSILNAEAAILKGFI